MDVTDVVQRYADRGVRSFPVTRTSLGGDPHRGFAKFLEVEYRNGRQVYRERVSENRHFTFSGPARGPVRVVPDLLPERGRTEVRFINRRHQPVHIYSVNQYGRWNWAALVRAGEDYSSPSSIGQEWVVATRRDEVLLRETARWRGNTFVIEPTRAPTPDFCYPGTGHGPTSVEFINSTGERLTIYTIDQWGTWHFVRYLAHGDRSEVAAVPNQRFIIRDRGARIVADINASVRPSTVRLR